jgi:hypothetical protein
MEDFLSLALSLRKVEEEEVQALEQILEQNQEALEVVQVLEDSLLGLVFSGRETTAEPTTEQLVEAEEVSHKLALAGLETLLEKAEILHLTKLQEL